MHATAAAHHAAIHGSHAGYAVGLVVVVLILAVLNHMWANARKRRAEPRPARPGVVGNWAAAHDPQNDYDCSHNLCDHSYS